MAFFVHFVSEKLTGNFVSLFIFGGLLSIVFWFIGNEFIRARARVPGLKGPKGWPVLGNYLDIKSNAAVKYETWAKQFGGLYQVQLGNTTVVVVNTAAAAKAVFMSTGQAVSSRPVTYTYHKIACATAGFTIGASPYEDSLKRKKKGITAALNRTTLSAYVPYFDRETRGFIEDLMNYGKGGAIAIDPLPFVQRLSMSLIFTINWGVRIPSINDWLFKEIIEVEEGLNRARSTVGNAQDHFPLLRLIPFNSTSTTARIFRDRRDAYLTRLDGDLAEKVHKGTNSPCIQASVMKFKDVELNETERTAISLSVLGGGFETVSSTMHWTIAHLALHPEIQDKAYEAICKFQGSDEPLCDASDDQKCEYVLAIAKEALRFSSVVTLGLPRASIKDIEYEGVKIPAGTTFYLNGWACNHDPAVFPDPDLFEPERWIAKPDMPLFSFGLGYRMCSGNVLSMRELYLIFMRLLSSFRIESSENIDCNPRKDMKNAKDLIMSPNVYQVVFKPRNEKRLLESLARAI